MTASDRGYLKQQLVLPALEVVVTPWSMTGQAAARKKLLYLLPSLAVTRLVALLTRRPVPTTLRLPLSTCRLRLLHLQPCLLLLLVALRPVVSLRSRSHWLGCELKLCLASQLQLLLAALAAHPLCHARVLLPLLLQ